MKNKHEVRSVKEMNKILGVELPPVPDTTIKKAALIVRERYPKKIDPTALYNVHGNKIDKIYYDGKIENITCGVCGIKFRMALPLSKNKKHYWFNRKEIDCPACDTTLILRKEWEKKIEKWAEQYAAGKLKPDIKDNQSINGKIDYNGEDYVL